MAADKVKRLRCVRLPRRGSRTHAATRACLQHLRLRMWGGLPPACRPLLLRLLGAALGLVEAQQGCLLCTGQPAAPGAVGSLQPEIACSNLSLHPHLLLLKTSVSFCLSAKNPQPRPSEQNLVLRRYLGCPSMELIGACLETAATTPSSSPSEH